MLSTWNIYAKSLLLTEAKAVYLGHGHQDFPTDELKPFSIIENLWKKGLYQGYGFYEKYDAIAGQSDVLRGYAFVMSDPDTGMLLLDYFAICEEARGQGYGGKALALLKEACQEWKGIIFEVEDDESTKVEAEKLLRQKRISFYEQNGVKMTKKRSSVFGVDYKLMVLPLVKEAEERIEEKLTSIYRKMLPEDVFQTMFRLR